MTEICKDDGVVLPALAVRIDVSEMTGPEEGVGKADSKAAPESLFDEVSCALEDLILDKAALDRVVTELEVVASELRTEVPNAISFDANEARLVLETLADCPVASFSDVLDIPEL